MKLTFFGIPLYFHWTWFIFILILCCIQPELLPVSLLAFFFVTLHEYGHSLMARWYNLDVADITLYPIGGVARIAFEYNDYKEELFVTIAGPLVNVVLAIVFFFPAYFLENNYFVLCFYVNFILATFNLLPLIPMDGGRILRSSLHKLFGNFSKATLYSVRIGQFLAGLFVFLSLACNLWIWALIFLWVIFGAQRELQMVQKVESFKSLRAKLAQVLDMEEFKSANFQQTISLLKSISSEEPWFQDLIVLLEEIKEIEP
jgi:Zn-dependent protease